MKKIRLALFIYLGFIAGSFAQAPVDAFVSQNQTQFILNCHPWYLYGGSVYGYSSTASVVSQAQALKMNTIRLTDWLDTSPGGNVKTQSQDATRWAKLDALIAACANAGLKVILDLSCYRNLLQQGSGSTATVNPYTIDWTTFLNFVVHRVNTVNGKTYGSDDTFAYIEFAGEIEPPNGSNTNHVTTAQINTWAGKVLTYWHDNSNGKQLLTVGGLMQIDWASGVDYATLWSHKYCDFACIHSYDNNGISQAIAWAKANGKPWISEEFGYPLSDGDQARANSFNTAYAKIKNGGATGAAIWNVGKQTTNPTYDVNSSGALTFAAVKNNAPPVNTQGCTTTGVEENDGQNSIVVYPNPFTTNFTLKMPQEIVIKDAMIKIYDLRGKEVKVVSIYNNVNSIDRGELKNGIYFYSIINNNEKIANGKLVVID